MEMNMMTPAERLQFVVRFAQLDLGTLRPGDWLNLKDDFLGFFGLHPGQQEKLVKLGGVLIMPFDHPMPQAYTEEDFRALQKEVAGVLYSLVDCITRAQFSITVIETLHIRYLISMVGQSGYVFAQGPTRDMFLFILTNLLWQHPSHILKCPECATIFYRIRKQQYCSRLCTNRANVRNWRQSEAGKPQKAERAHKRYEKKKKQEVGQGAKVDRRPRKGNVNHAETPRES